MWLSCPAVTVTHALKRGADLLQFAEKTGHQYTCTGVDVGVCRLAAMRLRVGPQSRPREAPRSSCPLRVRQAAR